MALSTFRQFQRFGGQFFSPPKLTGWWLMISKRIFVKLSSFLVIS